MAHEPARPSPPAEGEPAGATHGVDPRSEQRSRGSLERTSVWSDRGHTGRVTPPRLPRAGAPQHDPRLATKLKWLIVFRVVMVSCLLGAMLVFDLQRPTFVGADESHVFITTVAIATYLASLVYVILLRLFRSAGALISQTLVQLFGDTLLAASLVVVTGGTDSVFTFFFSLTIVNASILLFWRGAMLVATASAVLFLLIALVEIGVIPFPGLLVPDGPSLSLLGASDPRGGVSMVSSRVYNLVINVVAFYGIALLASYLSEQLRKSDIQHRETRHDLEDLRALHHNIVTSIMSALVTTTRDGKISFFNPVAEQITGFRETQVLGSDINALFPDLRHILSNEDKRGTLTTETTVQVLRGRTVYLQWFVSPLRDAEGSHVGQVLIFQDISRLKDMEAQVKRAEQLAGIGRLAAGIAHEIRNPLASISGSVQLLAQDSLDPDTRGRLMNIVLRETDHLNLWISDFLEFARPRRAEMLTVRLGQSLEELVEVFRNDPGTSGIDIQFEVDGTAAVIEGDAARLRQVFWNLLKNASQAMPDGGTIRVRIERALRGGVPYVHVMVMDTGVGIPQSDLERVFEPFYTTKERGTGLGLATSFRIIADHHGHIEVTSRVRQGTTFHVYLPELAAAVGDIAPDATPSGALPERPEALRGLGA